MLKVDRGECLHVLFESHLLIKTGERSSQQKTSGGHLSLLHEAGLHVADQGTAEPVGDCYHHCGLFSGIRVIKAFVREIDYAANFNKACDDYKDKLIDSKLNWLQ